MDLDTSLLLATIGLMVANRALHVGELWHQRRAVFWTIQVLNFCVACLLVTVGIPGFHGVLRIVNLVLAGLLILHTVQNNRRYLEAWREAGQLPDPARDALREQVLTKLSDRDRDCAEPPDPQA